MHLPIPLLHATPSPSGSPSAWQELQKALGTGLATAILETPDRRGRMPHIHDFTPHPRAAPADAEAAFLAFQALCGAWAGALDTLLQRDWDLAENPYAKAWILPGAILLHEDPISWQLDTHADALRAGVPLEDAHWALLRPAPTSAHATLAAQHPFVLAHAEILACDLDREASQNNLRDLRPLTWAPTTAGGDLALLVG